MHVKDAIGTEQKVKL